MGRMIRNIPRLARLIGLVREKRRLARALRRAESEFHDSEAQVTTLRQELDLAKAEIVLLRKEVDLLAMIHARDVARWKEMSEVPALMGTKQ